MMSRLCGGKPTRGSHKAPCMYTCGSPCQAICLGCMTSALDYIGNKGITYNHLLLLLVKTPVNMQLDIPCQLTSGYPVSVDVAALSLLPFRYVLRSPFFM